MTGSSEENRGARQESIDERIQSADVYDYSSPPLVIKRQTRGETGRLAGHSSSFTWATSRVPTLSALCITSAIREWARKNCSYPKTLSRRSNTTVSQGYHYSDFFLLDSLVLAHSQHSFGGGVGGPTHQIKPWPRLNYVRLHNFLIG